MRVALPSLVLLAAAAISAACGAAAFSCADASECENAGIGGVCQADGHCSFPDGSCPSGQRYGEHSGAVAGECVPIADDGTTAIDAESSSGTASATATTTSAGPTTSPLDGSESADATTTDPSITDTAATTDIESSESGSTMLDPDLLLWFSFEDPDASTYTNEGTLGGEATCEADACPLPIDGAIGSAYAFDGIDDCLTFTSTPELEAMDAFTVATWVRLDGEGPHFAFLAKPVGDSFSNSFAIYYYPASPDAFQMFAVTDGMTGATLSNTAGLSIGTWTHVVGTFDGSELGLWIDGVLVDSIESSLIAFDEHPVLVGCDDDHDEPGLDAYALAGIDDVRVYSRVLSGDEIAALTTRQ